MSQITQLSDYLFVSEYIKTALESRDNLGNYERETVYKSYSLTKEYALSHMVRHINFISIEGPHASLVRFPLKYVDISSDLLYPIDPDLLERAREASGKIVWGSVSTRRIREDDLSSFSISNISLYRVIKDLSYKREIGYMRISVDPKSFAELREPLI